MNLRTYFLGFLSGDDTKRKIAYAASFGVDNLDDWSQSELRDCRKLIQQFHAVSVREEQGLDLCQRLLGHEAQWVLDPTMLLSKEQYLQLIPDDIEKKAPGVFCYFLDKDDKKTNFASRVGLHLGLSVSHFLPAKFDELRYGPHDGYSFPSVEEWLAGFRDAAFVVTDSFHGTVFAILFGKPFLCIGNKKRGTARFTSLLRLFGLEQRIIEADAEISQTLLSPIDYKEVNGRLEEMRQSSTNFLRQALLA